MLNLLRLGHITANPSLEEKAARLVQTFTSAVRLAPSGCCQFLSSFEFTLGPMYHIVLVGNPDSSDTQALLRTIREAFLPNKAVLFRSGSSEDLPIIRLAPYLDNISVPPRAAAYLCENYTCQLSLSDPQALYERLHEWNP